MKFGVVIFPGSNCDEDMIHVLELVTQSKVYRLWHKQEHLEDLTTDDCVVLPGGFSYGDYLRPGAIANFSPIMKSVLNHANQGGWVFGVCNGFQILCETGLLPGALLRNSNQKFICQNNYLKVESSTPITSVIKQNVINLPIAHADGRYFADEPTLTELNSNNQVLFRYCDEFGNVIETANPNGSVQNIAGICNKGKNVFGMMPHPERASENVLGNSDGLALFQSLLSRANEIA